MSYQVSLLENLETDTLLRSRPSRVTTALASLRLELPENTFIFGIA